MAYRKRSKSLVRIPVTKGLLEGYHLDNLARERRALLMKMITSRKATYSDIIKRLNVLVIYNKNRHPDISDKVYRDLTYIQKHIPDKYKLSPISRSRTTTPFSSPGVQLRSVRRKSRIRSKSRSVRRKSRIRSKLRSITRKITGGSMRKYSKMEKW